MNENPFKYIYEVTPYRPNPFTVVAAAPDTSQARIETFASSREQLLRAGIQPIAGVELNPGDCITAAQLLQDPLLRLAFDLMLHCPNLDEESNEEADRN